MNKYDIHEPFSDDNTYLQHLSGCGEGETDKPSGCTDPETDSTELSGCTGRDKDSDAPGLHIESPHAPETYARVARTCLDQLKRGAPREECVAVVQVTHTGGHWDVDWNYQIPDEAGEVYVPEGDDVLAYRITDGGTACDRIV